MDLMSLRAEVFFLENHNGGTLKSCICLKYSHYDNRLNSKLISERFGVFTCIRPHCTTKVSLTIAMWLRPICSLWHLSSGWTTCADYCLWVQTKPLHYFRRIARNYCHFLIASTLRHNEVLRFPVHAYVNDGVLITPVKPPNGPGPLEVFQSWIANY